jgi:hypothetical protein
MLATHVIVAEGWLEGRLFERIVTVPLRTLSAVQAIRSRAYVVVEPLTTGTLTYEMTD